MHRIRTYIISHLFMGSLVGSIFLGTLSLAQTTPYANWRQHATPVSTDPPDPVTDARGSMVDKMIGLPPGHTVESAATDGIGIGVSTHERSFEELPINSSDAVVVATFASYSVHITPSGRSMYTIVRFRVKDVIKDQTLKLSKNTSFPTLLLGGTALLPSGVSISYGIPLSESLVVPGHRYLLFLQYDAAGNFYGIEKAWDFTTGTAVPNSFEDTDRLQKGQSAVAGRTESAIVSSLKAIK